MRPYSATAMGATVLLLMSWQALSSDAGDSAELLERLSHAQEIFEDNCAACHGYDGVPMLPGAANFSLGERLDKSDSELLAMVMDGKGDMPAWRDDLTEDERKAALAYIRLFSGHRTVEEKCSSCHEQEPPELVLLSLGANAARDDNGDFEICPGSDIEAELSLQEFAEIDRYLTRLTELGDAE